MDITLVTSTFNDEVHGTDNDKRTGCGISLIKPENVTRFRRSERMTDLKEITCERCKAALAKKIIRADKKEMSKIIKEERMRAKKGIEDERIVPLGNTTAKITGQASQRTHSSNEAARPVRQPDPRPEARPEPQFQPEPASAPMPQTIAGTNVAIDSSLAQFAIQVPKEEPVREEPEVQDDFLAQFAVQKNEDIEEPEPETPASPMIQDDFLAQFAIQAPESTLPPPPPINPYGPGSSSAYSQPAAPAPAYESAPESADEDVEVDLSSVTEWDLVANQIFGFQGAPQQGGDASAEMDTLPVADTVVPAPAQPVQPPVLDDIAAPVQPAAPVLDDLAAPVLDDLTAPVQPVLSGITAPVLDDIAVPAQPVLDDLAAPVLDDLAAPSQPVLDDLTVPVLNNISAPVQPVPDDLTVPTLNSISAPAQPVLDDLAPVQPAAPAPAPVQPEAAPVFDSIEDAAMNMSSLFGQFTPPPAPAPMQTSAPAPAPAMTQTPYTAPAPAPAMPETNNYESGTNMNNINDLYSQPVSQPAAQPVQPEVQPMQTAPVQPAAPVQEAPAPAPYQAAPSQPQAPVQPAAPAQPQIISVPQFAGLDANNQPIYNYVPMQISGYDPSGKPILVPVEGQLAQQAAAIPVPPVQPVQQPAQDMSQYKVPTANISKIAVNEHTKPTSRAFIQAISASKGYANKNLIETQGMQVNAPMLTSIEDVLSQIDTGSAKRPQAGTNAGAPARTASPVYNEYKANSQPAARRTSAPSRSASSYDGDIRFMTKSELKEKKKQEKIEAKFKKDMAKRGL